MDTRASGWRGCAAIGFLLAGGSAHGNTGSVLISPEADALTSGSSAFEQAAGRPADRTRRFAARQGTVFVPGAEFLFAVPERDASGGSSGR